MSRVNFTSPDCLDNIDRIVTYLGKAGPSAAQKIGKDLDLDVNLTGTYLAHMRFLELVTVAPKVRGVRGVRMWMLGVDPKVIQLSAKFLSPKRPVLKEWEPNHARGMFECLFFGVPNALQGVPA